MYQNSVSLDIAAPPQKVYDYLVDFTKHAEWSMSVHKIELIAGEAGKVGAQYRASEVIPQDITSFATITALEPPRLIAWESTDHQVFRTNWEMRIEPNASGGTHLTDSVTFHPLSDFGTMVLDTIRVPQVEPENLASLERVKKNLESK